MRLSTFVYAQLTRHDAEVRRVGIKTSANGKPHHRDSVNLDSATRLRRILATTSRAVKAGSSPAGGAQ
jgi:hypothetical protein